MDKSILDRLLSPIADIRSVAIGDCTQLINALPHDADIGTLWNIVATMLASPPTATTDFASGAGMIVGSRTDAYTLLFALAPRAPDFIYSQQLFWAAIAYGLRLGDGNRAVRKISATLFKQGLAVLRDQAVSAEYAAPLVLQHQPQWDAFVVLMDAVEDFPPYLLEEVWEARLPLLLSTTVLTDGMGMPAARPAADDDTVQSASSHDAAWLANTAPGSPSRIPIPRPDAAVPFAWCAVLLDRAAGSHPNPHSRRTLMLQMFEAAVDGGQNNGGGVSGKAVAGPALMASPSAAGPSKRRPRGDENTNTNNAKTTGPASAPPAQPEVLIPYAMRLPPWWVAGALHLPAHLAEATLFRGTEDVFGRALTRFLVAYLQALHDHPSGNVLLPYFVRTMICEGLPATGHARSPMKRILRALAAVQLPPRNTVAAGAKVAASPGVLDGRCLAHLRMALSCHGTLVARTVAADRYRDGLRVALRWCDPSTIGPGDLGLFLASFPASLILQQPSPTAVVDDSEAIADVQPVRVWMARGLSSDDVDGVPGTSYTTHPELDADADTDAEAEAEEDTTQTAAAASRSRTAADLARGKVNLHSAVQQWLLAHFTPEALSAVLAAAVGAYFTSPPGPADYVLPPNPASVPPVDHTALTAAGLARLIALLPSVHQQPAKRGCGPLDQVLEHLFSILGSIATRAYMPRQWKDRALLLLGGLLSQLRPGNRLADVATSCYVRAGVEAPPKLAELGHPLQVEYAAAVRKACRELGGSLQRLLAEPGGDTSAAPEESGYFDGAVEHDDVTVCHHPLRRVLEDFLAREGPASEIAAVMEELIAPGLDLTQRLRQQPEARWSPSYGIAYREDVATGSATAASSMTTVASLFTRRGPRAGAAQCVSIAPPAIGVAFGLELLDQCTALVGRRTEALGAVCGRLLATAVKVLRDASSGSSDELDAATLHVRAVQQCCAMEALAAVVRVALPATATVAVAVQPVAVLQLLLSAQLKRPKGVEDPAVPLPAATDGNGGTSDAEKPVSWLSLRTFYDQCRWTAVVNVLRVLTPRLPRSNSLFVMPAALSEAAAAAVVEGLDTCNEDYCHTVFAAAALVSPSLPCQEELALSALPNGLIRDTTIETLLQVSRPIVRASGLTYGQMKMWAEAVLQPSLFRPERELLHVIHALTSSANSANERADWVTSNKPKGRQGASAGTKGNSKPLKDGATFPADAGVLRRHIIETVEYFADDIRPAFGLQIIASALVRALRPLLQDADATAILTAYCPTLVTLLLHREPVTVAGDEPLLLDPAARAQMLRWLRAWRAETAGGAHDTGYHHEAAPQLHAQEGYRPGPADAAARRADADAYYAAAEARLADGAPRSVMDAAATVHNRGAGCTTRLQILFFVQEVCDVSAVQRARLLLQASDSSLETECTLMEPPAILLHRLLLTRLMGFSRLPSWQTEPVPGSAMHGVKLRTWQALALLAAHWGRITPSAAAATPEKEQRQFNGFSVVPRHDLYVPAQPLTQQDVLSAGDDAPLLTHVWDPLPVARWCLSTMLSHALPCALMASSRDYMELAAAALGRRFPLECYSILLEPGLQDVNIKTQVGFTEMIVAADLSRRLTTLMRDLSDFPVTRAVLYNTASRLFQLAFSWMPTSVGLIRAPALLTIRTLGAALWSDNEKSPLSAKGSSANAHPTRPPGYDEWIAPVLRHAAASTDLDAMLGKIAAHVDRLRPAGQLDPLQALLTSPVSEHGEVVPQELYLEVRRTYNTAASRRFARDPAVCDPVELLTPQALWARHAGLLPANYILDSRLRFGYEGGGGGGDADRADHAAEPEAAGSNFQRKILSQSSAAPAAAAAASSEPVTAKTSDKMMDRVLPVLTHRSAGGNRPCQPLVVVASLVDKVPNLAGLARTCEVFAAECLVLRDVRVAGEAGFKDMSATAAEWVALAECPPTLPALTRYLQERKAQGYSIVGLEQAARSVPLGQVDLPDKMVLVLGAERNGVPVELLQLLDVCVEIPQLGMVRSLNVHVSGAMLVWEYTKQRLARVH